MSRKRSTDEWNLLNLKIWTARDTEDRFRSASLENASEKQEKLEGSVEEKKKKRYLRLYRNLYTLFHPKLEMFHIYIFQVGHV